MTPAPTATPPPPAARRRGRPPSDVQVRRLLGPARPAWVALVGGGENRRWEWKRYSANADWVTRLVDGKRTVLWARPTPGELRVTVILGEKAVGAGLASALPQRLKARLRSAPVYPEGRTVRLRLRSAAGVADVERLLALKLGSWRGRSPSLGGEEQGGGR